MDDDTHQVCVINHDWIGNSFTNYLMIFCMIFILYSENISDVFDGVCVFHIV